MEWHFNSAQSHRLVVGQGDLVGGMGFVGPFHVLLADMLIDKEKSAENQFFYLQLSRK